MQANEKDGPPRRILLATDLSGRCDRATDRAVYLAKAWNAELIVLHVMEPEPIMSGSTYSPSWRIKYDPQQRAERRVRDEIGEILPGVSVIVERGDPAAAILRVAEARSVDFIVSGVARDEPLGRVAIGSTVEKVLGRCPCPLLVVRKRGLRPYRNIVSATDFSLPSRQALETAVRLFPDAAHSVFHAYDAIYSGIVDDAAGYRRQHRDMAAQDCRKFLEESELSAIGNRHPGVILEHGAADQLLSEYALENDVDLAVMGTRGHGTLYDIFIGSVAKKLVMSVPCDALLVRPGTA